MLEFLTENYGSIIAGAVVLAIVMLVIIKMVKDKRAGKNSCGGSCESCKACGCCARPNEGGAKTQCAKR